MRLGLNAKEGRKAETTRLIVPVTAINSLQIYCWVPMTIK